MTVSPHSLTLTTGEAESVVSERAVENLSDTPPARERSKQTWGVAQGRLAASFQR
jgi:hypothetical protein